MGVTALTGYQPASPLAATYHTAVPAVNRVTPENAESESTEQDLGDMTKTKAEKWGARTLGTAAIDDALAAKSLAIAGVPTLAAIGPGRVVLENAVTHNEILGLGTGRVAVTEALKDPAKFAATASENYAHAFKPTGGWLKQPGKLLKGVTLQNFRSPVEAMSHGQRVATGAGLCFAMGMAINDAVKRANDAYALHKQAGATETDAKLTQAKTFGVEGAKRFTSWTAGDIGLALTAAALPFKGYTGLATAVAGGSVLSAATQYALDKVIKPPPKPAHEIAQA